MNQAQDVLYVADIARKLGRTEKAIRAAIAAGSASIPRPAKLGKMWAWRRADVDSWLESAASPESSEAAYWKGRALRAESAVVELVGRLQAIADHPRSKTAIGWILNPLGDPIARIIHRYNGTAKQADRAEEADRAQGIPLGD